ncbi:MAG: hypothetical protein ACYDCO_01925 [Armatimonadota bacterium]
MITKQTTIYKCEHCRKWGQVKAAMVKHERHCASNPYREPKAGELYGNEYNNRFFRYPEGENRCQHMPSEDGMIWTGYDWLPVPEFHEGRYGEPQYPAVGIYDNHNEGGTPLDKVRTSDRLQALEKDYGPAWGIVERSRRIEAAKSKMLPPPERDPSDPFVVG